jgi:hypothetical protein
MTRHTPGCKAGGGHGGRSKSKERRGTGEINQAAATATRQRILSAYREMLRCQFYGTVAIVVVTAVVLVPGFISNKLSPPLLLLVVLAGMLGAFFSALTRLYHVDEAGAALITPTVGELGGKYMFMYATVPSVIGAIAAVVLYVLFVSGLVAGDLFPSFACTKKDSCQSMSDLMQMYWPKQPTDYGKALVWSFIAGFSERFVPDLLQSLVKNEAKKSGGEGK